jgi:hypothetical protein
LSRFETISFGIVFAALSAPAFAGDVNPAPTPLLGVGVGAAVLVGVGYRALRNRIRP